MNMKITSPHTYIYARGDSDGPSAGNSFHTTLTGAAALCSSTAPSSTHATNTLRIAGHPQTECCARIFCFVPSFKILTGAPARTDSLSKSKTATDRNSNRLGFDAPRSRSGATRCRHDHYSIYNSFNLIVLGRLRVVVHLQDWVKD